MISCFIGSIPESEKSTNAIKYVKKLMTTTYWNADDNDDDNIDKNGGYFIYLDTFN